MMENKQTSEQLDDTPFDEELEHEDEFEQARRELGRQLGRAIYVSSGPVPVVEKLTDKALAPYDDATGARIMAVEMVGYQFMTGFGVRTLDALKAMTSELKKLERGKRSKAKQGRGQQGLGSNTSNRPRCNLPPLPKAQVLDLAYKKLETFREGEGSCPRIDDLQSPAFAALDEEMAARVIEAKILAYGFYAGHAYYDGADFDELREEILAELRACGAIEALVRLSGE